MVRKNAVALRGRRVVVEDHRDQPDGEHQAGSDAPPEFEPDRVERDLLADPLSLAIAAIEIVRQDRQQRAEKKLKHRSSPSGILVAEMVLRHVVGFIRASVMAMTAAPSSSGTSLGPLAGRHAGHLLERPGDPAQRPSEVGKVDQGEQQASHPEDVHVGEEGQQAQHGDDLELQLVGLVRHALGQRVQAKEQDTDRQHGQDQ